MQLFSYLKLFSTTPHPTTPQKKSPNSKTGKTDTWMCNFTGRWKYNNRFVKKAAYKINWKSLVCSSRNNELPNGGSSKNQQRQLIPFTPLQLPTTTHLEGRFVDRCREVMLRCCYYAWTAYLLGVSPVLHSMKTAMSAVGTTCGSIIISHW